MKNKMTMKMRYKGKSFDFIKEVNELRLYIQKEHREYAIIVDKNHEVIFELEAWCYMNCAAMHDASNE